MSRERGTISVQTENIFPIIKKWLYSEKDIFVRELVSNASDAITRLKKLAAMGEAEVEKDVKYSIKVVVNKKDKTVRVIDNGIGMTDEEVRKYINQIAFSGVVDFFEKYRDKTDESQIIGHFGLGFYSAFMVSEKVQIDTLSYQKGAAAVRWTSADGMSYEMDRSDRSERGTTVTLWLSEDSTEFLDYYKMREVLEKYFSFLPYEVFLEDAGEEKGKDKEEEARPINDTRPLWLKKPKDCTDEEYREFYRKAFRVFDDPLFWIHLDVDYPVNLKGILYFPRLRHEFDALHGQIKLFYNQVFVADNIKEIIPEFLLLLKGVLDCPDLPLNVSRSFLQTDDSVRKISNHITRKVADKLISIFENEREKYNSYWDDIHPFVKFGCMKEEKFYDRVKDIIIFRTTGGDYVTLKDYLKRNGSRQKDTVFYVTDERQQAQYIKMFKDNGMEAVILPSLIDVHFVQFLEFRERGVKFARIDADLSENLKETQSQEDSLSKEETESLEKLFREYSGNEKLNIRVEALKVASLPAVLLLSEQSRRMRELSRIAGDLGFPDSFPEEETLVLNSCNSLIKTLVKLKDREEKKDDLRLICEQVYDLAVIGNKPLEPEAMTRFIERTNRILNRFAQEAL